ncbi:LysR family transcriptional regulator [Vibrio astriarenae]
MDDIANHKALICVAETGSLGGASEQLGKSKVMISRAIKTLEDELGFRLLDRNARGSKLTAKGSAYVETCRPVIQQVDSALNAMALNKGQFICDTDDQQIPLKLSSPNTFGSIVLSEVIADFQKAHSHYRLELVTDEQFQDIFDHKLDISIRAHLSSDSIHDNLISRPLIKLPFFLCCTPEYLTRYLSKTVTSANGMIAERDVISDNIVRIKNISIDEWFAETPFVAWSYLGQHESVLVDSESQRKVTPVNVTFISNNSISCRNYLMASEGFAFLPLHVIRQALNEGKLIIVTLEPNKFEVDLRITYMNAQGRQSATNRFVEFLMKHSAITTLRQEIQNLYIKLKI